MFDRHPAKPNGSSDGKRGCACSLPPIGAYYFIQVRPPLTRCACGMTELVNSG